MGEIAYDLYRQLMGFDTGHERFVCKGSGQVHRAKSAARLMHGDSEALFYPVMGGLLDHLQIDMLGTQDLAPEEGAGGVRRVNDDGIFLVERLHAIGFYPLGRVIAEYGDSGNPQRGQVHVQVGKIINV